MKHFIWLLPVLLIGCYETGVVYRGVESECLQSSSSGTIVPMRGVGIPLGGGMSYLPSSKCTKRAYYNVVKRYEGWGRWTYFEKTRCRNIRCEGD